MKLVRSLAIFANNPFERHLAANYFFCLESQCAMFYLYTSTYQLLTIRRIEVRGCAEFDSPARKEPSSSAGYCQLFACIDVATRDEVGLMAETWLSLRCLLSLR